MIGRLYVHLIAVMGFFAILCIAAMLLLITIDVSFRYTGVGSLGFALEGVEYCIFLCTFFSAPWVLYQNGHVTVDFLVRGLPDAGARRMEVAGNLVGLVTTLIVLVFVCRLGFSSWAEGMRVIRSIIFPEWWLFAVAALSLILIVVEFVLRLRRSLTGSARNAEIPTF